MDVSARLLTAFLTLRSSRTLKPTESRQRRSRASFARIEVNTPGPPNRLGLGRTLEPSKCIRCFGRTIFKVWNFRKRSRSIPKTSVT